MLKLFSARSDHPLAAAEEVDRIVADLAGMEPKAALREIADWLDSLDAATDFSAEKRFGVLARFDDAAVQPLRVVVRDIFTTPRQVKGYGAPLFQLGRRLFRRIALGYTSCFDANEHGGRDAEFVRRALPQLASRLLRAHAQWLKWSQFRYGPVDPVLWADAGAAYTAAVEAGCDRRRVTVFSAGAPDTCPHDEYLRALVFQVSAPDRLRPLEIELVDKLISRFLPLIRLGAEASAEALYWIDPARPMAPMRLARKPKVSPTLCYLGLSGAVPGVVELMGQASKGELPAGLDLGAHYPPKLVLPVLAHLSRYWGARPPTRVHARHPVQSATRSVLGFSHIYGQLSGKPAAAVSWQIEDVSRGGFGVRASLPDDELVHLGTLLGLQPEGGENWVVGIIRRIARAAEAEGRLGIETLSHAPVALEVELSGHKTDVLLLDALEAGASVRLALPQFGYDEAVRLRVVHDGRIAELEPVGLLESADACDVARYRVVSLAACAGSPTSAGTP